MADIDDDLPAQDQDGGSAAPFDADGNQVVDGNGPIDVPLQGGPADGDESIEMQEDGSALVALGTASTERVEPLEFFVNLAEHADAGWLNDRATELLELIERDTEARKNRDEQYAEGIKRTGLGGEAPGGADFEGASRVVHPVLAEGCVDFSARAMKEIFPPNGPCRTKIVGKSTPEKIDKAERKRQYMNWQLTSQIEGYRTHTKKLLTQLPLGGSQYKLWWYDHDLKRPDQEFVTSDNVILPSGSQDFYTSQRITVQQDITEQRFAERVDSKLYRDIDNLSSPITPEETKSAKATQKVEGTSPDPYNQDGLRRVFMVNSAFESVKDDKRTGGVPAPYMWHIDETTRKVLGLYRNWDPDDDDTRKRLHWLIDYTFIHWRGPQGIGLLHLIGSMSGAATGALRSILDNALAQNALSGFRLKGGRTQGTTEQPAIGEVTELEGPTAGSVDDIRKLYMPFPFNPTSPVLFQVLQWIVDQARGVVQVANEKLADGKTDMPVGSTLALIEEGSHVFSDIHAGLHASQGEELKILHRLDKWFLSDKETVEELGDLIVQREDFAGPCDIIPVSDPLIFSETQRYAQMQAMWQLASTPIPQVQAKFDYDRMLEHTIQLLHAQQWEDCIKTAPEAEDLDPVSENMVVGLGEQPVKAFNFQDHFSHLRVHLHFMTSPMFGGNPLIGPKVVAPLIQHCLEHMIYAYVNHAVAAAAAGEAVNRATGFKPSMTSDGRFAVTLQEVDQMLSQEFMPLGPMFQQAIQLNQQYQQQTQPPMDPASKVQLQVGMAEINRKQQQDQASNKIEQGKVASSHMIETHKLQATAQQAQAEATSRQQLDAMIQSQKDQRERDAQAAQNQREQDKLAAEGEREQNRQTNERYIAEMRAHSEQQTEAMKQMHETHRHEMQLHIDNAFGALKDHLTRQHEMVMQPKAEVKAQGGSVDAAGEAPMVMDPEHTAAIGKLSETLAGMPQAQGAGMERVTDMILRSQTMQTSMLSEALKAMGSLIASGLQQTGQQVAAGQQQVAQAMGDIGGALSSIEDMTEQVSQLQTSTDKLHEAVKAPRVRTLKRDRKGNKVAIDRPAKEGETE